MAINYNKGKVPLNSPLHKDRNPSFRKNRKNKIEPMYKDDYSWMPGNTIARRYANGILDMENLVDKVCEAFDRMRGGVALNEVEKVAISLIVPGMEHLVDKGFANTQLRLSDKEKALVRALFIAKYKEGLNWNAGYGGGSVKNRTTTLG